VLDVEADGDTNLQRVPRRLVNELRMGGISSSALDAGRWRSTSFLVSLYPDAVDSSATSASAELRVLGVVTVLWWVLPGPCFGAYGAAVNSMRMAALSTTFEPAKLEEAKNLSFCGCIRRPVGGPPGPPPSPYAARHCFGRSLSVHSGRHKAKVRRVPTPCHSQRIAHWGPCGKTRVVLQNLRPKPEPADIRDSRRRCALVEVWVSRDVEPPVGLAVRLRALGAEVRGCAPLDGAEQLAEMQP
jgi:hypothetical protein